MDTGMQPSGDECVPVQRSHVHENESHEDMHRGTEAPADELTRQKGASPLQQINMCFSCFTGGFGVRLYIRERESSHASDDV
jgi:hypothetical protein